MGGASGTLCHCRGEIVQSEQRVASSAACNASRCSFPTKNAEDEEEEDDGWWAVDPWSGDVIGGFVKAQSSKYCCEAKPDADCASDYSDISIDGCPEDANDLVASKHVAKEAVLLAPTGNHKRSKRETQLPTILAGSVPQGEITEPRHVVQRSVSAPASPNAARLHRQAVMRQVSSGAEMAHAAMREGRSRGQAPPMDMSHWDDARAVMDAFRNTPGLGLVALSPSQAKTAQRMQRRFSSCSPVRSRDPDTPSTPSEKAVARTGSSLRAASSEKAIILTTSANSTKKQVNVVRRRSVAFGETNVQEFEASPPRDVSPPPREAPAADHLQDAPPPPRAAPAAQADGLLRDWNTCVLRVQMSGNKFRRLTFSKHDDLAKVSSAFLREHGLSGACQAGLEAILIDMVQKNCAFLTVDITDII